MPDDSSGNFTLLPSYRAEPGQTIMTTQHNQPLEDIAVSMSRRMSRDGRSPLTGDLNYNGFRGINVGAPVTGSNIARLTDVRNAAPVGGIIDYAGEVAPPDWLFCNGQAVSRTDFPYLFTIIGTTYGAGDGVTTFNVPDLRGRIVAGADNMGGAGAAGRLTNFPAVALGATGGSQNHVLVTAELAAHSHTGTASNAGQHNHTGVTGHAGEHLHNGTTVDNGNHAHTGSTDIAGNHTHAATYNGAASPFPGPHVAASMLSTSDVGATPVTVAAAGDHLHPFVTNANGSHNHTFTTTTDPGHVHSISTDGAHTHAVTTTDTGTGAPHNNVQPTFIMNKIMRAR